MAYKLMIVDDDKDIVEMLERLLSRQGYETVTAFDGEDALAKIGKHNPDIILLDLTMPKTDGFDVLREIRQKHKDKWRPVIVISAKTDLDAVRECYSLEADHYLTKPCSVENILRGIETMISLIPLRQK